MDYQAEKEQEIEAIESIYMDSLQKIDDNQINIEIWPYSGEDEKNLVGLNLSIIFSPKYPDEPLDFSISNTRGLIRSDCDDLKAELDKCVKEWLGSVYIFNLTTACQEYLLKMNDREYVDEESELEKIQRLKEAEKAELEKLTRFSEMDKEIDKGTAVTIEIFKNWQKEFDAKRIKKLKDDDKGKLTGKQLFEQKSKWVDESLLREPEEGESIDDELFLTE